MRKLSKPENYSSPVDAAASLRATATEIERHDQWVNWHLSLWFATPTEVRVAMKKKFGNGDVVEGVRT